MAVFGFGRRNAVGRQYNGGNVSVMLPRYTTPPERNTRDWLEMFGRNPRLAVVDRIASDLSTCAGKLYRVALLAEGVDRNRYLLKINKAVVGRPPPRGGG